MASIDRKGGVITMPMIKDGFIKSDINDILHNQLKVKGSFMPKKKNVIKNNNNDKEKKIEIKRALSSLILSPGDKFEIIEPQTNKTFLPGTMGYFCNIIGRSEYGKNGLNCSVVTLRRGKGGKPRLESNNMIMPIFHEEHTILSRPLRNDAEYQNYFVLQNKIPVFVNLLTADPEDFLGWCYSYTLFLNYLSKTTDFKNVWPKSSKHTLNVLLRLSVDWIDHNDIVMEKYTNEDVRAQAILTLREMETRLYRRLLAYNLSVVEFELFSAREYVSAHAMGDKHTSITKKCVQLTVDKYSNKQKATKKLLDKSKPKSNKDVIGAYKYKGINPMAEVATDSPHDQYVEEAPILAYNGGELIINTENGEISVDVSNHGDAPNWNNLQYVIHEDPEPEDPPEEAPISNTEGEPINNPSVGHVVYNPPGFVDDNIEIEPEAEYPPMNEPDDEHELMDLVNDGQPQYVIGEDTPLWDEDEIETESEGEYVVKTLDNIEKTSVWTKSLNKYDDSF